MFPVTRAKRSVERVISSTNPTPRKNEVRKLPTNVAAEDVFSGRRWVHITAASAGPDPETTATGHTRGRPLCHGTHADNQGRESATLRTMLTQTVRIAVSPSRAGRRDNRQGVNAFANSGTMEGQPGS